MDRRRFLRTAAGLFIPAAPALILPKSVRAQMMLGGTGCGGASCGGGGGSEGTVNFDLVTASGNTGGGVTSATNLAVINPGTGPNGSTNLALVVLVFFNGGITTGSNPTCTVNGL